MFEHGLACLYGLLEHVSSAQLLKLTESRDQDFMSNIGQSRQDVDPPALFKRKQDLENTCDLQIGHGFSNCSTLHTGMKVWHVVGYLNVPA